MPDLARIIRPLDAPGTSGVLLTRGLSRVHEELREMLIALQCTPARRVFIKPNLGGREPILPGENTSAEFLIALCRALTSLGSVEIDVGHTPLLAASGGKTSFKDIVALNGYERLLRLGNVRLLDLSDGESELRSFGGIQVAIPKPRNDRLYINVAKLKTHMETSVSLGIKNQMGLLVRPADRKRFHREGLDEPLGLLAAALRPDVTVIEGLPGMEGDGPHHGEARTTPFVIFSRDVVFADGMAAILMGLDPRGIGHLLAAEAVGAGQLPAESTLKELAPHAIGFRMPRRFHRYGLRLRIFPGTSCSQCLFNLSAAANHPGGVRIGSLVKHAFLRGMDLYLGRQSAAAKHDPRRPGVCLGDCAKHFATDNNLHSLPGCPPSVEEIGRFFDQPH